MNVLTTPDSNSAANLPQVPATDQNNLIKTEGPPLRTERLSEEAKKDIVSMATEAVRKDFLTTFGIFASLITYVSVQIQIFSSIRDPKQMIAVSSFSLGGLLLFAITLHSLASHDAWIDYKKASRVVPSLLCIAFIFVAIILLIQPMNQIDVYVPPHP